MLHRVIFLQLLAITTPRLLLVHVSQLFVLVTQLLELLHQLSQVLLRDAFFQLGQLLVELPPPRSLEMDLAHHFIVPLVMRLVLRAVLRQE